MLKLNGMKGKQSMMQRERKKHVPIKSTSGYIAKAVRHFYSDLADTSSDNPQFIKALKLASRSYNDLDN